MAEYLIARITATPTADGRYTVEVEAFAPGDCESKPTPRKPEQKPKAAPKDKPTAPAKDKPTAPAKDKSAAPAKGKPKGKAKGKPAPKVEAVEVEAEKPSSKPAESSTSTDGAKVGAKAKAVDLTALSNVDAPLCAAEAGADWRREQQKVIARVQARAPETSPRVAEAVGTVPADGIPF